MNNIIPKAALLALWLTSAFALAQPFEYRDETTNFVMQLPERMYPTGLNYDQDTSVGPVHIKNLSFHGSTAKYVLQRVDYPANDTRSPNVRFDDRINQLQASGAIQISNVEFIGGSNLAGMYLELFDGRTTQAQAMFVDGTREYHLSAESFSPADQADANRALEQMIRSFNLATADQLYYAVWQSRATDAQVMAGFWPNYQTSAATQLQQAAASNSDCTKVNPLTPADLVVRVQEDGLVSDAWSSPRGLYGRCIELAAIGLQLPPPPASPMHLLLPELVP